MKNVSADLQPHQYVCLFLLFGAQTFSRHALRIRYVTNIPVVMPNLASVPKFSRNEGE